MRIHYLFLALVLALTTPQAVAGKSELKKTDSGWQMFVDGKPFYIKGFTWSHTPVGKKYDYNLFEEEEEPAIKEALKRDLTLIRRAGGNTLRHIIPIKWMKHIHALYGMHFISNDYCGRYGLTIDGKYVSHTDYSDPKVREMIKQTWRDIATEYKDAPGLIAHALGNENNYGLEWVSAAVENLPQGERQTAKARYLYSLFNEVALEVKKIDPDHPVGIVNGDLQYLDLIAELCPDIDYIGVNAYRGRTYSDMFERVAKTLDIPVILMETGCDAFNAVQQREDQLSQAEMIHHNWIDLYRNTAGNGGSDNCIGALCFQWADEWWKHGQEYELEIHNTQASWSHGGYPHDAAAGQNMNEEWFGVCSIRREAIDGAHLIQPRAAYYTLKELWKKDPYTLDPKRLSEITFNAEAVMAKGKEAEEAVKKRLADAEIPYSLASKPKLPIEIYTDAGKPLLWHPSGVMPAENFLAINPNSTTNPYSGDTCLEIKYQSGGDWSGVMWQHPANDWHNNSPGGFDLSDATTFSFYARGQEGGEVVEVNLGGSLEGLYPNTMEMKLGMVQLTKEWKKYSFPLGDKDRRRIKNPFTLVFKGNGFPFTTYFDEVVYE